MPKIKSKSGVSKRFKITGTGKVLRKKSGARHNMGKKSSARKRWLRKKGLLTPAAAKKIKSLIPYS